MPAIAPERSAGASCQRSTACLPGGGPSVSSGSHRRKACWRRRRGSSDSIRIDSFQEMNGPARSGERVNALLIQEWHGRAPTFRPLLVGHHRRSPHPRGNDGLQPLLGRAGAHDISQFDHHATVVGVRVRRNHANSRKSPRCLDGVERRSVDPAGDQPPARKLHDRRSALGSARTGAGRVRRHPVRRRQPARPSVDSPFCQLISASVRADNLPPGRSPAAGQPGRPRRPRLPGSPPL